MHTNLERLIVNWAKSSNLNVANLIMLDRADDHFLSYELCAVKRNLLIFFNKASAHVPNFDFVIYEPSTQQVVAVVSIVATDYEKITETAYWKYKLKEDIVTSCIKVFIIELVNHDSCELLDRDVKLDTILNTEFDGYFPISKSDLQNDFAQLELSLGAKILDKIRK